ncbi:hypothetical protein [Sphingobacterium griseoflavum]|uniref:Uncharacterized protein n=1 Tax=Sphingobacterium griseoflavum TaxID=1474952 RepID=A0ABQ3HV69_9SPHI|nr:hypothetical protein [Sphingobacterium griseoflavum]GHE31279.1 hypothetical protein GCM10017764_12990 [Sphingobacterium griseoflavum]
MLLLKLSKKSIRDRLFKSKFKFLNNKSTHWKGYSFKKSNSVEIHGESGSIATLKILSENLIEIIVQHDGREWKGQITLFTKSYGKLFFKYTDKEEFGTKDCYINSERFGKESILLIPTNNSLLSTENTLTYSYGKELFQKQ